MQNQPVSFAELLAPFPEDRFFAEAHDRRPLHIRGAADKFADLMNWRVLNELLNMTAIWSPESLQLVLDRRPLPSDAYCREAVDRTNRPALQPDADKVKSWLQRGASLVANDIDTLTPGLAAAADALERTLGGKVQSNLYCSWRQRQAFATHFDTHEVFALHAEGEKTWRIYEGRLDRPIAHPAFKSLDQSYHDAHKGSVMMEVRLRPGDLLYIPRGYYHDALASSAGTVHVTFGVTHVIGYDLLNILLAHAATDPLFRTNFPLPFEGEAAARRHLAALVERLGHLAAGTAVANDVLRFRETYKYPRGGFDLPADSESTAYVVAGKDFRLARRDGKDMVEGPTGALQVPASFAPMVGWILAQGQFAVADLRNAFPQATDGQRDRLLANLVKTNILAPA